ncbi:salicylate hydroxylase [Methylopila jiangsuensis]|uniref:Salicylate hydroxylase n=1 Tax=Methylopila jiangsuensis TaxID=586230 RepID=A0A9W6JEZ4_9HYPH|nr:FAD-dependent monooxygenase [Methylopila jiangsuensis]MDR6285458.1 salicylate hydroxylase [Methylopila jiangsuensis]GLK75216.1 salicylate hydroxylase [Methylopila jiangsuensis]
MAAPVLIAGAGIGGLTLALALARRGVACEIFERAAILSEVGAGVQLAPNASRILDGLGLGPALDAAASRPEGVRIVAAESGRLLRRLPLGETAERRWGAPYRVIHRADLHAVLSKAVAAEAGAALHLGGAVTAAETLGGGAAFTVTREGAAGRREGRFGVGADGLRSAVRGALKLSAAVRETGLVAYRAVVPAERLPGAFPLDHVSVWLAPGAHLVLYPVRGGREANVVLIGALGSMTPVERVARWADPARTLAAGAGPWTEWPLFDRPAAPRLRRGALALLGDAAHATLPSLGQGAAFAIEDAATLARLIADGGPDPLGAYEKARLMRVGRLPEASRRQARIDHLGGLAATARNLALAAAPTSALLGGLDWLYGWRDAA